MHNQYSIKSRYFHKPVKPRFHFLLFPSEHGSSLTGVTVAVVVVVDADVISPINLLALLCGWYRLLAAAAGGAVVLRAAALSSLSAAAAAAMSSAETGPVPRRADRAAIPDRI